MKSFLLNHKWTIIYLIIFAPIFFYLAPRQHDYYLDNDIKYFKSTYLTPFLSWTGVVISIIALILAFAKTRSVKQAGASFISAVLALAFFLFIFSDIFLGASLFVNRQFKRNSMKKTYVASYMVGTDQTIDNFNPYDVSTGHISTDDKLINKLYHIGLKQGDTIILKFNKGLLGIGYQLQPFNDR